MVWCGASLVLDWTGLACLVCVRVSLRGLRMLIDTSSCCVSLVSWEGWLQRAERELERIDIVREHVIQAGDMIWAGRVILLRTPIKFIVQVGDERETDWTGHDAGLADLPYLAPILLRPV